jgi:NADPH2:quinone reductase
MAAAWRSTGQRAVKALQSQCIGGPETLVMAEAPDPVPSTGELRIAVHACAINYPDVLMIEDKYQFRPARPFSPGVEISGVVEATAPDVTEFVVGQRVMASITCGGLAQKAVAASAKCSAVPDAMPFDVAAAFQVTYGTAYHALVDRAALQRGETLLVLGASGGVGIAAIELGRALGARVVAAVSSSEKADIAKSHGATEVVVYPKSPTDARALAAQFKAACPGGADVIFDPLGGAYAEPALRSIAWAGRHLVIGFAAGIPGPPWNLALLKSCAVVGVFWGAWLERFPDRHRHNTAELIALYLRGAIRPLVSERYPLRRGGEAIRCLADRRSVGKIVVMIDPD